MLPDDQLDTLLKQGGRVEVRSGFEQAVWSRIHAAGTVSVPGWRREVMSLAIAAGVMIGLGLGFLFPVPSHDQGTRPMLVHNGSLTGAYLALVSGGDHE